MATIGIDLGTSQTRVAWLREDGTRELIQFPGGARNVPTIVAYGGETPRVGRVALARATTDPGRTVRAIKRFLGRAADDPVMQALAARSPFKIEQGEAGSVRLRLGDKEYAPEEVAATLISYVAEVVEQTCGERPESAVLATPYWYGPRQRKALGEAARLAGIGALQVLSEATCTALSLLDADPGERMVAIVDVGAGGCTASVLEICPNRVRLISSAGDPLGGGEDVDWALARAVFKGLQARFGQFSADAALTEMLRQTCEVAKQSLSQVASVTTTIPFLPIGSGVYNQEVEVDRDTCELLVRDTATRVGAACRSALEGSRLPQSGLAAVYATGGSSRLKAVRTAIEDALGPIASRKLDPDGSVALGAAWQAGMLAGMVDSIPVLDVQSTTSLPPPTAGVHTSLPPARIHSVAPPRTSVAPIGQPPPNVKSPSIRPPSMHPGPTSAPPPPLDADAVRLEIASLLASLRAGALTGTGGRKQRGMVARTNDIVEEATEPDSATIEQNALRLQSIWSLLGMVMQTSRQYRWHHPQTIRCLDRAFEEIRAGLAAAPHSIVFDIGSTQFSYRGATVWKPDRAPFDRIPFDLLAEGVRRVQLQVGLTLDELRDFLGVLLRDASLGFGCDDDSMTALAERGFLHVAWLAVDAFAEGDDPAFREQRDAMAKQLSALAAFDDSAEELLDAYTEARRQSHDLTAAATLDAKTRSQLTDGLILPTGDWLDRYANGLVQAWLERDGRDDQAALLASIGQWVEGQVTSHASAPAMDLFCALDAAAGRLQDRNVCERFSCALAQAMFPMERMQRVLDDLAEDSEVTANVGDAIAKILGRYVDDSLLEELVRRHDTLHPDLQKTLVRFVVNHPANREMLAGKLLLSCSNLNALAIVRSLQRLATPRASTAITVALGSAHPEVRLEALLCLPGTLPDRARDDLQRIIEDPVPSLRLQALQSIGSRRILAAGPAITRRIQDDKFMDLPHDEKRLLFKAVCALNRRRAEELAISWLDKQHVFSSDALEQTRTVAAEFLATAESEEALDALKRASRRRLFSSPSVRSLAAQAAESVVRRRASSVPPKPRRGP